MITEKRYIKESTPLRGPEGLTLQNAAQGLFSFLAPARRRREHEPFSGFHLLDNLETQLNLHRMLLSVLEAKRRAAIERDVFGMEAAGKKEQAILERIERMERWRDTILESMGQRAGRTERLPLEEVLHLLPAEAAAKCKILIQRLTDSCRQIVLLKGFLPSVTASRFRRPRRRCNATG